MKVDLNVELYAICVGVPGQKGVGSITHTLEITTEADHLYLPITANILSACIHKMVLLQAFIMWVGWSILGSACVKVVTFVSVLSCTCTHACMHTCTQAYRY